MERSENETAALCDVPTFLSKRAFSQLVKHLVDARREACASDESVYATQISSEAMANLQLAFEDWIKITTRRAYNHARMDKRVTVQKRDIYSVLHV